MSKRNRNKNQTKSPTAPTIELTERQFKQIKEDPLGYIFRNMSKNTRHGSVNRSKTSTSPKTPRPTHEQLQQFAQAIKSREVGILREMLSDSIPQTLRQGINTVLDDMTRFAKATIECKPLTSKGRLKLFVKLTGIQTYSVYGVDPTGQEGTVIYWLYDLKVNDQGKISDGKFYSSKAKHLVGTQPSISEIGQMNHSMDRELVSTGTSDRL